MASTQPSTTNQISEEYVHIFKEAYVLRMPPYDFRVWDAFLFARCTNENQVPCLLRIFEWPIMNLPGSSEENIQTVGQWCRKGTFVDEVIKVIQRMTDDIVDVAFLEAHRAIFKEGPIGLSRAQTAEQIRWIDQAKACIKATSPNATTPETVTTPQWHEQQKRQQAYFAFGSIVWMKKPDPSWSTEDRRLGIWFFLGFSFTEPPHDESELFSQYRMLYSKECGISITDFETFFSCLSDGLMFEKLKNGWTTIRPTLRDNLERFFRKSNVRRRI